MKKLMTFLLPFCLILSSQAQAYATPQVDTSPVSMVSIQAVQEMLNSGLISSDRVKMVSEAEFNQVLAEQQQSKTAVRTASLEWYLCLAVVCVVVASGIMSGTRR